MWVLIKHELKRFFKSKFSIIFIALILALNIFLGINYKNQYKNYTYEDQLKSMEKSVEYTDDLVKQYTSKLEELNNTIEAKDTKLQREEMLQLIDECKTNHLVNKSKLEALKNNDNRRLLEIELNFISTNNKKDLEGIQNHKISYQNPEDFDRALLNQLMYQYLYDNNLYLPIDIFHNISALDLLITLFEKYYILILPILFLLISATSISGECSNNTYKLLFSQPINKYKIISSKIISSFIISLFFIFLATISTIIIGTLLNGFGNLNYPVLMFENLSGTAIEPYSILKYTHIEPTKVVLVKLISYFLLVSLFVNSMAILISSLFKNKLTSIVTAIIIFVGTYFTAPIITGIKAFNPMTYLNAYEIITGVNSLTEPKIQLTFGIILLSSLLIIFTILSTLKVKKLHL